MKSIKTILGTRETITVNRGVSVLETAKLMAEHRIGAVPVVDDDRLVGVFSERDILTRIVAAELNPATTPVGDVMSSNLIVAESNESYDVCLNRMRQSHVRHLIVLEKGSLYGIASMRDVLAADIDEKSEAITLLNAYVHFIPADLNKTKT